MHEPNAGRIVTVTLPDGRNDAYYRSLSVERLLKEIRHGPNRLRSRLRADDPSSAAHDG